MPAPTASPNVGALNLAVILDEDATYAITFDDGVPAGTWTAQAGLGHAIELDVTVDGDDVLVELPGDRNREMVGNPWRLRLDGDTLLDGHVVTHRSEEAPDAEPIPVVLADATPVTATVVIGGADTAAELTITAGTPAFLDASSVSAQFDTVMSGSGLTGDDVDTEKAIVAGFLVTDADDDVESRLGNVARLAQYEVVTRLQDRRRLDTLERSRSTFVFDSSATQGGNTYSSWADLMAAVAAINGPKVIQFDQNETIPTTGMPVAGWDLNGATLAGHGNGTDSAHLVTFPNGCKIRNPGYPFAAAGIALYSTSSSSVLTVSTPTTIVLVDDALVLSKSAAFINVTATTGRVVVSLRNGSGLVLPSETTQFGIEAAGDYESVNVTGTLTAFNLVDTSGSTYLSDNVIRGGTGVTMARVVMTPADPVGLNLGDTQANAVGWTVIRAAKAYRVGFTSEETVFDGIGNVADALDALAQNGGGSGPDLSDATPAALGTAAAGVGTSASRSDHVHALPGAAYGTVSHRGWGKRSAESGTWAVAAGLYLQNSSTANTDYIEWAFLPLGGTYTISLAVNTGTSMGQYRVSIDGSNVGSLVEGYAASGSYTSLEVGTGIVVAPGVHTVRISVPSKNASSSAHVLRLVSIDFIRTA